MKEEFYCNEKPDPEESGGSAGGSHGGIGGSGGSGGWGGGGSSWGDIGYGFGDGGDSSSAGWDIGYDTDGGSQENQDEWFWITKAGFHTPPVLLESPEGVLLTSGGKLLLGNKGCVSVGIECHLNP